MMLFFLILTTTMVFCVHAVDEPVPIVKYESNVNHDGSYKYSFETGDGVNVEQQGFLKNADRPDEAAQVAQGKYAYTAPDGEKVSVSYIADENGYQPESDSLPVPPEIPVLIQRALEYLAANPPQ